jgi:hypothetical protein
MSIDRAHTYQYVSREDKTDIKTSTALVTSATAPTDVIQQLAVLEAEVATFKGGAS